VKNISNPLYNPARLCKPCCNMLTVKRLSPVLLLALLMARAASTGKPLAFRNSPESQLVMVVCRSRPSAGPATGLVIIS